MLSMDAILPSVASPAMSAMDEDTSDSSVGSGAASTASEEESTTASAKCSVEDKLSEFRLFRASVERTLKEIDACDELEGDILDAWDTTTAAKIERD